MREEKKNRRHQRTQDKSILEKNLSTIEAIHDMERKQIEL